MSAEMMNIGPDQMKVRCGLRNTLIIFLSGAHLSFIRTKICNLWPYDLFWFGFGSLEEMGSCDW